MAFAEETIAALICMALLAGAILGSVRIVRGSAQHKREAEILKKQNHLMLDALFDIRRLASDMKEVSPAHDSALASEVLRRTDEFFSQHKGLMM